jgi:hypothetical protein
MQHQIIQYTRSATQVNGQGYLDPGMGMPPPMGPAELDSPEGPGTDALRRMPPASGGPGPNGRALVPGPADDAGAPDDESAAWRRLFTRLSRNLPDKIRGVTMSLHSYIQKHWLDRCGDCTG